MSEENKALLAFFGVIFVVLGLLGVVGTLELEDEKQAQENYCEMVKRGSWPDHKGTYHEYCEQEDY
jgi:hypothetical protein